MLNTGIKAPNFELPDQNGTIHIRRIQRKEGNPVFLPKG